jgi:hypothetical protein
MVDGDSRRPSARLHQQAINVTTTRTDKLIILMILILLMIAKGEMNEEAACQSRMVSRRLYRWRLRG